jgi:hypothetical protein
LDGDENVRCDTRPKSRFEGGTQLLLPAGNPSEEAQKELDGDENVGIDTRPESRFGGKTEQLFVTCLDP